MMFRRSISEHLARGLIYVITSAMVLAFFLFASSARQQSLVYAQEAAPDSAAAMDAGSVPSSAGAGLAEGAPQAGAATDQPEASAPGKGAAAAEDGPLIRPNLPDKETLNAELARVAALGFSLEVGAIEPLGSFHTTAYCCEVYPHICGGNGVTASGTVPTPGLTVAADWSMLPRGTWLFIDGVGIRRVEDTGSAIKEKRLDVVVDTHENALRWSGFGQHRVWVLVWGNSA